MQALYRPGSSCAVRYRVRATNQRGRSGVLIVSAETRAKPRSLLAPGAEFEGRFEISDPVEETGGYLVWAFPYDPALKGLEQAAHGPTVRDQLQATGRQSRAVHVTTLRYRPRRRALFRYRSLHGSGMEATTVFGKVLRSVRAQSSIELTERLEPDGRRFRRRRSLPVKLALPSGRIGDNTLLFEPMPGRPLRDLLLGQDPLPDPGRIVELTRGLSALKPRLEGVVSARHARRPEDTIASTADLLSRIAPQASGDVAAVREAVVRGAEKDPLPRSIVHGDLYDAQIFVGDDFSLGLVDVDDLGLGDPALDAANFTTHLLALALARPAAQKRLTAYRSLLRQGFLDELDITPADLAWREAFVMMQLATGPFRVLDASWPDRVVKHIRVARRLIEAVD